MEWCMQMFTCGNFHWQDDRPFTYFQCTALLSLALAQIASGEAADDSERQKFVTGDNKVPQDSVDIYYKKCFNVLDAHTS